MKNNPGRWGNSPHLSCGQLLTGPGGTSQARTLYHPDQGYYPGKNNASCRQLPPLDQGYYPGQNIVSCGQLLREPGVLTRPELCVMWPTLAMLPPGPGVLTRPELCVMWPWLPPGPGVLTRPEHYIMSPVTTQTRGANQARTLYHEENYHLQLS